MFESVPVNQHYVWRHYLEAWAVDGKVTCHRQREKKTFASNPRNIASGRFFYSAEGLTGDELAYLRRVAADAPTSELRELELEIVETFAVPAKTRRAMDLAGLDATLRGSIEKDLLNAERGLGEFLYGDIERAAIPFLDSLRKGDASFWPDREDILDFCRFVAAQFLRTKRMATVVRAALPPRGLDLSRVWTVESVLWSYRITAALHRDRALTQATILVNETGTPFVTGDQPIVNLRPQSERNPEFYYPVSPKLALLLTRSPGGTGRGERQVYALEAESYNHRIFVWSEDQLYGTDPDYLTQLAAMPKVDLT